MPLTASDVMKHAVKTIRSDVSLADLERRLVGDKVSGFPVVDDGVLRGVISRSDIVRQLCTERSEAEVAAGFYEDVAGIDLPVRVADWIAETVGREIDDLRVSDVMVRKLITVEPSTTLREVAKKLVENRIHRILVTQDKQLQGIITAIDFARLFAEERIREC